MTDKIQCADMIDINSYPVNTVLETLLTDKSAGRNIIFAAELYGTKPEEQIMHEWLISNPQDIQPRVSKSQQTQQERTRKSGEVFTPSWICSKMNNYCDEEWFGRKNVFNTEIDQNWVVTEEPIKFDSEDGWKKYVESNRLEITCGEAPYLVSRYDSTTGELIETKRRIGILDRKMRVVNENTDKESDWLEWTKRAFQSVYGYEFQGDSLLIARINLLNSFADYLQDRWGRRAADSELHEIAGIVSWNIWQMDGLTGIIPFGKLVTKNIQLSFEDTTNQEPQRDEICRRPAIECKIYDWHNKKEITYNGLKKRHHAMKFDFCIGNPPYQEPKEATSDTPVYNSFMDAAFQLADRVELITPARFLFNAGKTPKAWNEKMLADEHFKVLYYEQDGSKIFANTDIKGGIAITYRDIKKKYGAISVFSNFAELRSTAEKIKKFLVNGNLSNIMFPQNRFKLDILYEDYPEYEKIISSNGKERRIVTSSFEKLSVFSDSKQTIDDIQIIGIVNSNSRGYRWINKKYIEDNGNLNNYKVLIPKSNGSGAIGEVLSTPLIGPPLIGYTQSFIGIGSVKSKAEAKAILKYVSSKFARALLGILKATQHNPPETWQYVPLQDFTSNSDIDWSKSVKDIDKQLYKKYGLSDEEIAFIESHVKEMN